MNITGVSLGNFLAITDDVSLRGYGGNVIVAPDAHNAGRNSITARLRVRDSCGPGARTAASGRHGPYACWHAYRDVLWQMFVEHPDATARTVLATYRGFAGFDRDYPATRHHNIGSMMYPASMPDLCVTAGCGDEGPPFLRTVDDGWDEEEPAAPVSATDDVLARITRDLAYADRQRPDPLIFEGPASLLDAPDLAYSGR
jgi:hypothetical protein